MFLTVQIIQNKVWNEKNTPMQFICVCIKKFILQFEVKLLKFKMFKKYVSRLQRLFYCQALSDYKLSFF